MKKESKFSQVKDKYFKTLELYVPIVARVHGTIHPEFMEVRNLVEIIIAKTKDSQDKPNLDAEFTKLRKLTNNYEIPSDVCESYASVYNVIEKLDKAYHN